MTKQIPTLTQIQHDEIVITCKIQKALINHLISNIQSFPKDNLTEEELYTFTTDKTYKTLNDALEIIRGTGHVCTVFDTIFESELNTTNSNPKEKIIEVLETMKENAPIIFTEDKISENN